jgi:GT2 family glycosyltransferase
MEPTPKLSIVILCWNDLRVIRECLRSIHKGTREIPFEVIVSDNGSTDGSIEFIRDRYPTVRVLENRENLGFARGNNVGIRASRGGYVLILNPDTIIHDGAFDRLVAFADRHPEAGGFGCRVLNPDGSGFGAPLPHRVAILGERPLPKRARSIQQLVLLRGVSGLGGIHRETGRLAVGLLRDVSAEYP